MSHRLAVIGIHALAMTTAGTAEARRPAMIGVVEFEFGGNRTAVHLVDHAVCKQELSQDANDAVAGRANSTSPIPAARLGVDDPSATLVKFIGHAVEPESMTSDERLGLPLDPPALRAILECDRRASTAAAPT
jgi:hypothetical protein